MMSFIQPQGDQLQASPESKSALEIDWDIEVTINSAGNYVVSGVHDCFPAHEVFIGETLVYSFIPSGTPPFSLPQIGSCLSGQNQIQFGTVVDNSNSGN